MTEAPKSHLRLISGESSGLTEPQQDEVPGLERLLPRGGELLVRQINNVYFGLYGTLAKPPRQLKQVPKFEATHDLYDLSVGMHIVSTESKPVVRYSWELYETLQHQQKNGRRNLIANHFALAHMAHSVLAWAPNITQRVMADLKEKAPQSATYLGNMTLWSLASGIALVHAVGSESVRQEIRQHYEQSMNPISSLYSGDHIVLAGIAKQHDLEIPETFTQIPTYVEGICRPSDPEAIRQYTE